MIRVGVEIMPLRARAKPEVVILLLVALTADRRLRSVAGCTVGVEAGMQVVIRSSRSVECVARSTAVCIWLSYWPWIRHIGLVAFGAIWDKPCVEVMTWGTGTGPEIVSQ